MRWLATVVRMDGRRIDLLELTELGRRDAGDEALMGDIFGVLLTVLLLGANAFFVGAEFALISARRDRLEALAEQGKKSAVTVIRAGENLLADARRRPAGHHDLLDPAGPRRRTRGGAPAGEAFRRCSASRHGAAHRVVLHRARRRGDAARAARRDGAEEHRDRRARSRRRCCWCRRTCVWVRAARPFIAFYNWCANVIAAVFGVEPKDELDVAVSTVELSEMIAESLSEGLLDPEEHTRLTRALRIRNRVVDDVAVPLQRDPRGAGRAPRVGPDAGARSKRHSAETGYSRFPVGDPTGRFIGYLHIKDVLPLVDDPDARCWTRRWCVRCRRCPPRCRCPTRCPGCAATTATWRW